ARVALGDVDRLAAKRAGLGEPLRVEVADDHRGRAEQLRGGGRGQPDRAGPGDVDGGSDPDARAHAAVETGREDVGEHGQVEDLRHRPVPVGELQRVEVGVGHQHVAGLPADPAAHVDVAVGRAGPVRVDVETDAGGPLLAVAAPPAGDVERHRHQVPDVQELHVRALLHHLPGDLVPQHQAGRCGGAAAHHVLVAAADVGGDHFEDHAVVHLPADVGRVDSWAVPEHELRHVQVDDLDLARALV